MRIVLSLLVRILETHLEVVLQQEIGRKSETKEGWGILGMRQIWVELELA